MRIMKTPMPRPEISAVPIVGPNGIEDVRLRVGDRTWHLWGRQGRKREADLARSVPDDHAVVLMGTGLGLCARALAKRGIPVAIVDRFPEIRCAAGMSGQINGALLVDDPSPAQTLERLLHWKGQHPGRPIRILRIPVYLRLDRDYCEAVAVALEQESRTDLWQALDYPKFQSARPRILFFDSGYFLCNEIRAALTRMGADFIPLDISGQTTGSTEFIETLLHATLEGKPDFALTVNHFGMDREGRLAELLQRMHLPLASWFVDNPHLILHRYAHPAQDNTILFTFDAGNLDTLRNQGFPNVHYLPLATDPQRFRPGLADSAPDEWTADISFVGNSMTGAIANSLEQARLPRPMQKELPHVAASFGQSGEVDVESHMAGHFPAWKSHVDSLANDPERQLATISLVTWEATRQYRLSCVREIQPFSPLIVGDPGWDSQLSGTHWRRLDYLDYYADLPRFYPRSQISFNCTSRQMKGAVNQRIFDVPACGGFVLTDRREQLEDLFEPETESVAYENPEQISPQIQRLLADKALRKRISRAARKRILAEHTYEHRLARLISVMRQTCL